jgi:hypothetical protein
MSYSPEYHAWAQMIQRCHNRRHAAYSKYGGRKILVCKQWKNSFVAFLKEMGRRPSPKHSLDRIDNSTGYSPENCRWATKKEQSRNTKINRILTLRGKSMTKAEWSELTGIPASTIYTRLERGWSLASALNMPVHQ